MALLSSVSQLQSAQQAALQGQSSVDMNHVITVILGGGQGTRLAPLTKTRCKPAVPIAGKYLLIDIPISNALNSGCNRIYVITQFLSNFLHQHIFHTYTPSSFSKGALELLAAEQGPTKSWFQGTADAIRQNLNYFHEVPGEYFLILSGDQLYHMDFSRMVGFAKETNADLVIASLPVVEEDAKRMGLLKLNEDRFITEFCEKPQERAILDHMRMPDYVLKQLHTHSDSKKEYLGSMGIYLFKRKALLELMEQDPREDFGKHLIPTKVGQGNVAAYLHEGYWEDIGTIGSFFQANIALTQQNPPFNCYNEKAPIYSQHHQLPPSKVWNTHLKNTLLCDGCLIEADEISNSIIGVRSQIKPRTTIRNSYIIGNDFYFPPKYTECIPSSLLIEEGCFIENAIIDRNVHIGKNVKLINKNRLTHFSGDHIHIKDGVIVVTAGASLPDDFVL